MFNLIKKDQETFLLHGTLPEQILNKNITLKLFYGSDKMGNLQGEQITGVMLWQKDLQAHNLEFEEILSREIVSYYPYSGKNMNLKYYLKICGDFGWFAGGSKIDEVNCDFPAIDFSQLPGLMKTGSQNQPIIKLRSNFSNRSKQLLGSFGILLIVFLAGIILQSAGKLPVDADSFQLIVMLAVLSSVVLLILFIREFYAGLEGMKNKIKIDSERTYRLSDLFTATAKQNLKDIRIVVKVMQYEKVQSVVSGKHSSYETGTDYSLSNKVFWETLIPEVFQGQRIDQVIYQSFDFAPIFKDYLSPLKLNDNLWIGLTLMIQLEVKGYADKIFLWTQDEFNMEKFEHSLKKIS
jgi:hypothetical protein